MEKRSSLRIVFLIVALVLPTLGAWLYYSVLSETSWAGVMYLFVKMMMIVLGIVGWRSSKISLVEAFRVSGRQTLIGFIVGIMMTVVLLAAYLFLHQQLTPFADILRNKTASLFPLAFYGIVAMTFSIVHSFFEEWYWRAFVGNELNSYTKPVLAMIMGGLAFSAHHAVVLAQVFPQNLVLLMSTGIFMAGVFWSYLAHRAHSFSPGWISHMIVDGMIFIVGATLLF